MSTDRVVVTLTASQSFTHFIERRDADATAIRRRKRETDPRKNTLRSNTSRDGGGDGGGGVGGACVGCRRCANSRNARVPMVAATVLLLEDLCR
jgi:hypothetical protein